MCRDLIEIHDAVVAYASGFDVGTLTPSGAEAVVSRCARMEASLASVRALAAARAAESGSWKDAGYRSAADKMAADIGTTPSAARRAISTGQRLAQQPDVAQAALAGELSPEQTEAVADGAAADPAMAVELIGKARCASLSELNDEVARVKAANTDIEARRRRLHERRSLRRWTDRDGAFHAHLIGHPEDGARLWRAIDPIRRRLNLLRQQQGTRDNFEALDYDSLLLLADIAAGMDGELSVADLCELGLFPQLGDRPPPRPAAGEAGDDGASQLFAQDEPGGTAVPDDRSSLTRGRTKKLAGSPAKIMVRVDLDTLLRGVPIQGEVCEIAGYGPVPVSVVEELAAQGNSFIVGVLTAGTQILSVYHHRRRPNAAQRSGLDFLHPACAAAGCNAKAGLQYDHRVDWAKTHFTVFDLLDRLCPHHHNLKTRQGWALVHGNGKRAFVPPTDPRHPGRGGTRSTDPPP